MSAPSLLEGEGCLAVRTDDKPSGDGIGDVSVDGAGVVASASDVDSGSDSGTTLPLWRTVSAFASKSTEARSFGHAARRPAMSSCPVTEPIERRWPHGGVHSNDS